MNLQRSIKMSTYFSSLLLMIDLSLVLSMKKDDDPAPHRGGEIVRGLPCIKRLQQGTKHKLSCGSAGNSYPADAIDNFIDDNKAWFCNCLSKLKEPRKVASTRVVRTYRQERRFRRDVLEGTYEELLEKFDEEINSRGNNSTSREKRQSDYPGPIESNTSSGKEDVCQSSIEVVTPFWASNSNGKVRAIINNKEFEQAIHQEICGQSSTARCSRDCGCEQRYKWHRLLAYDPNNDCAGVFMDWFLFPSCCVCRCNKNPFLEEKND